MPCLILMGHPCAGKTTFAQLLKERALQHSSGLVKEVVIVNEENVCCVNQTKAECYATSQSEKATRSALKAALDKSLAATTQQAPNNNTLVILDSMNYIKGYRYELYCLGKAEGTKHGVIWILNSVDTVRQWNQGRYPDELLDELIQRFEPPDARNRWDRPLYRIDLTPSSGARNGEDATNNNSTSTSSTNQAAQDALQRSVYNMHSLSDAITDSAAAAPPVRKPRATKSAASSFKKKRPSNRSSNANNKSNANDKSETVDTSNENQTTQSTTVSSSSSSSADRPVKQSQEDAPSETRTKRQSLEDRIDDILDSFLLDVEPLKEGMSTQQTMLGDANVLHQVDSLTQKVCTLIAAQVGSGQIDLTDYGVTLRTSRTLALPELKRLRQKYIRWVTQHPPADASERGIVSSFVRYVEGQV